MLYEIRVDLYNLRCSRLYITNWFLSTVTSDLGVSTTNPRMTLDSLLQLTKFLHIFLQISIIISDFVHMSNIMYHK